MFDIFFALRIKHFCCIPTTSGMELELLQITGHPEAMASKGEIPKPSYKDR